MLKLFLRSGYLALPLFIIPVLVTGFFYPGYDQLAQHASVLSHPDSPVSGINSIASVANGLVMFLSSIALTIFLFKSNRPYVITGLCLLVSSIAFTSNGIFPMGSPLHGLFATGFFSIIGPLAFVTSAKESEIPLWFRQFTLIISLVAVVYLWMMVTGMDPKEYRGLTQKIAGSIYYSWFAAAAWTMKEKI